MRVAGLRLPLRPAAIPLLRLHATEQDDTEFNLQAGAAVQGNFGPGRVLRAAAAHLLPAVGNTRQRCNDLVANFHPPVGASGRCIPMLARYSWVIASDVLFRARG